MKNKKYISFFMPALFLLLLLCTQEQKLTYRIPKDYRLWKKPLSRALDYPVPGHGATVRVIYANEKAYQAKTVEDKFYNSRVIFPDGTVIIKEVYKKRKDINMEEPELTVMIKDTTNKNALDGWMYYLAKPGTVLAELMSGRMCIGCHEAANDRHPYFDGNKDGIFRDYIFLNIAK